jgi:hypothetical protein
MNRRFRAFDAESGKIVWETILGGIVQMSTITYAVNGKQYVAVMTGDGNSATRNPVDLAGITTGGCTGTPCSSSSMSAASMHPGMSFKRVARI